MTSPTPPRIASLTRTVWCGRRTWRLAVVAMIASTVTPVVGATPALGALTPNVVSVSPAAAPPGATVVLTGAGLAEPGLSVTVGKQHARITAKSDTRVVIEVPANARLGATTLSLSNRAGKVPAIPFTVAFDGRISPTLDRRGAVKADIGPDGGTVIATASNGTRYSLTIPPGGLATSTTITLTPVRSINDLPLSGGLAGAVQFEPSGLQFLIPATLAIAFATGSGELGGIRLRW